MRIAYSMIFIAFLFSKLAVADTLFVSSKIYPGEMLQIQFEFSEVPTSSIGRIDFLEFSYGGSFTDFWTDGNRTSFIDVNLYDGEKLLSTKRLTGNSSDCCHYIENGSPGVRFWSSIVDVTSIANGTIDGKLEYIPYFDDPSKYSSVSLSWGFGTGTSLDVSSWWPGTDPIISSYSVSKVPLPGALSFFLLGVISLFAVRKYHA